MSGVINHGENIMMARRVLPSTSDNYELHQYGPYLAVHKNQFFLNEYNQIKHPLLLYFVDIAEMLIICSSYEDYSIRKMREMIYDIINRSKKRIDKYSDLVETHGLAILNSIKEEEKKENVNESAILSCAPIVCYGNGMLVKSEVSDLKKGTPNPDNDDLHTKDFRETPIHEVKMQVDEMIEKCLRDHVVEILMYNDKYIIRDGQKLIDVMKGFNRETRAEYERWILNYRIAVYMKYNIDKEGRIIFNILNDCNIIRNGGRLDIEQAVKSFST